jgi:putative membrane protein
MFLKGLVIGVALLHLYFLVLEMFFWTKPLGLKVFAQSLEKAKASQVLAANQGLYNGFLSAGLLWSLLHPVAETALQLQVFFLSCVVVAGVYGAFSVSKKILWVQAMPAAVALGLIFLG